jgi:hypothetical protein
MGIKRDMVSFDFSTRSYGRDVAFINVDSYSWD